MTREELDVRELESDSRLRFDSGTPTVRLYALEPSRKCQIVKSWRLNSYFSILLIIHGLYTVVSTYIPRMRRWTKDDASCFTIMFVVASIP